MQKYGVYFVWFTSPAGYKWENCEPCDLWGEPFASWKEDRRRELEELVQSIPEGPYLIEVNPRLRALPCEPLEDPLLFAQFADIRPDEESFRGWANEHGRLIDVEQDLKNHVFIFPQYEPLDETDVDYQRSRGAGIMEKDGRYYRRAKADPLGFWLREYRELSFAVMLWELAQNNDQRLDGILEWNQESKRIHVNKIWKEKLNEIDFTRFGKDETYNPISGAGRDRIHNFDLRSVFKGGKFNAAKAASIYVQQEVTRKLAEYSLQLTFRSDDDGELRKALEPTNLLAAMWHQLYLAQTGEIQLRRCSLCGKWENMEGHRSTWSKHANCANYGRVKRARNKKRERANKDELSMS